MIPIPIFLLYLVYAVFLVGFFAFSAFSLYHLEEYGYVGDFSRPMVYIYIGVAATIMLVTSALLIFTII